MNVLLDMPVAEESKTVRPENPKILLVDDDPAIRQILRRLLTDEDYQVVTAANGLEALEITDASIDLVLLDLNMPLKDGWDTFEALSFKYPWLPIILITARPNQFFPALASGVGALLEKPLDFVKLFDTVRALLEEPAEVRRARMIGQPSVFQYVQPNPVGLGTRAIGS
jgi:DNA-binding response OmpR family regulator